MESPRISVVIPAFNEVSSIGSVLDELIGFEIIDEIIVVDDGSSDQTPDIVAARQAVKLVRHPYNIGNGAAVKSGIRAATGDIIILMDGDGQHPPSEIPNLLQYVDRYEMVVGARTATSQSSWQRKFANRLFNTYASYIVGYPVPDLTSGFRAVRAPILRSFLYLLPNGFSYPTTITIALFRAGFAVKYAPFVSPSRIGQSKIHPLRDGLRFLLTLTRLAVFFVPLKIFVPLSLLFLVSGIGYTLITLVQQNRFSGFGGLVTTIGILLFLLGLIAEQVAMLRYINSDR